MRLIDADALEELFREVISGIAKKPEMTGNLEHMIRASAMVVEMIQDAPTIEPERKKGKWVDKDLYKHTMARTLDGYTFCNKCNHHEEYGYRSNYCPNCGARMEVEE